MDLKAEVFKHKIVFFHYPIEATDISILNIMCEYLNIDNTCLAIAGDEYNNLIKKIPVINSKIPKSILIPHTELYINQLAGKTLIFDSLTNAYTNIGLKTLLNCSKKNKLIFLFTFGTSELIINEFNELFPNILISHLKFADTSNDLNLTFQCIESNMTEFQEQVYQTNNGQYNYPFNREIITSNYSSPTNTDFRAPSSSVSPTSVPTTYIPNNNILNTQFETHLSSLINNFSENNSNSNSNINLDGQPTGRNETENRSEQVAGGSVNLDELYLNPLSMVNGTYRDLYGYCNVCYKESVLTTISEMFEDGEKLRSLTLFITLNRQSRHIIYCPVVGINGTDAIYTVISNIPDINTYMFTDNKSSNQSLIDRINTFPSQSCVLIIYDNIELIPVNISYLHVINPFDNITFKLFNNIYKYSNYIGIYPKLEIIYYLSVNDKLLTIDVIEYEKEVNLWVTNINFYLRILNSVSLVVNHQGRLKIQKPE